MKVLLRRDLFFNGSRYRQSNNGTEVPDAVGDKKVVLWKEKPAEDEVCLPRDAKLFDEGAPREAMPANKRINVTKVEPVALSQMKKPLSDEEMLAKKA